MSSIGHNNPPSVIDGPLHFTFADASFHDDRELGEDGYASVSRFIASCGDLNKLSLSDLAHLYVHVKTEFEKLDAARDELSKFVELMKNQKLPEAFDREKMQNVRLTSGHLVRRDERLSCTIIDKERGFQWLEANGLGEIVTETVNSSTMASVAKSILANVKPKLNAAGEQVGVEKVDPDLPIDLPDDLFKVSRTATTAVTKGKATK